MKLPLAPSQEELLLGYNAHHLPKVSMKSIYQIGLYMKGLRVREVYENDLHGMPYSVWWINKEDDTSP